MPSTRKIGTSIRKAEGTYSGTPTWTGTTPPVTPSMYYKWAWDGNYVELLIAIIGASAGLALTGVDLPLPSDCPAAVLWSAHNATNNLQVPTQIAWSTSDSAQPQAICTSMFRNNAKPIRGDVASGAYKNLFVRVLYPTF